MLNSFSVSHLCKVVQKNWNSAFLQWLYLMIAFVRSGFKDPSVTHCRVLLGQNLPGTSSLYCIDFTTNLCTFLLLLNVQT